MGIFIKNELTSIVINDYKFTSTSKVESLWLEVSKNNKKYIVAGIYRHPNKDIRDFSVQLEIILENISKKKTPCIIAGDINIYFAKYGVHHETTDYVNNLLVNNLSLIHI